MFAGYKQTQIFTAILKNPQNHRRKYTPRKFNIAGVKMMVGRSFPFEVVEFLGDMWNFRRGRGGNRRAPEHFTTVFILRFHSSISSSSLASFCESMPTASIFFPVYKSVPVMSQGSYDILCWEPFFRYNNGWAMPASAAKSFSVAMPNGLTLMAWLFCRSTWKNRPTQFGSSVQSGEHTSNFRTHGLETMKQQTNQTCF